MARELTKWKGILNLMNSCLGASILTQSYIIGIVDWYSFLAISFAFLMTILNNKPLF